MSRTVSRRGVQIGWVLVLTLLAVFGPPLLERNQIALQLRGQLVQGHVEAGANRRFLARPDEAPVWRLSSHHGYALAVAGRQWVVLSNELSALPDSRLMWQGDGPVPPSAYAAVLQRAAEQLAFTNPDRAAFLGRKAKIAVGWREITPDPGNVRARLLAGDLVAVAAETRRVSTSFRTSQTLTNSTFSEWMVSNGLIPRWSDEAGVYDSFVDLPHQRNAPSLILCTKTFPYDFTLRNSDFSPEAGRRYQLSLTARAHGAGAPTIISGVQYLDSLAGTNTGAYVIAGVPSGTWNTYHLKWLMPVHGSDGRFVIRVVGSRPGQCVEIKSVGADDVPP